MRSHLLGLVLLFYSGYPAEVISLPVTITINYVRSFPPFSTKNTVKLVVSKEKIITSSVEYAL